MKNLKGESNKILSSNDLIKLIIKQIEKNEPELIQYHKNKDNKYGLIPVRGSNQFTNLKNNEYNLLTHSNIAKFLGLSREMIRRWLKKIEKKAIYLSIKNFRKIRASLSRLFRGEGKTLKESRELISSALKNYANNHFDMNYINQICFLIDDCAFWDSPEALAKTIISKKMGMNLEYLRDQEKRSSDTSILKTQKLFNITINFLLIDYNDFKFESRLKYLYFKKGVIDIIQKEFNDDGLFENESKPLFRALLITVYALTIVKINYYGALERIPHNSRTYHNPKGLVTLEQVFGDIGYNRKTVHQNIIVGRISPTIIAKLIRLLESNEEYAQLECRCAISLLDSLPQFRSSHRSLYTGMISHPILEYFFQKLLLKFGICSQNEFFFNRPNSYHRIDTRIELTKPLIDLLSFSKLESYLHGIREIFIDYTIPTKQQFDTTLNKIEKYYDEGRLLFIVFYGFYSSEVFDLAKNFKYFLSPDKQKNFFFMDVNNLAKLFSASKEDIQFLKLINKLIEGSLKLRNGNLSVLEKYSKMAVYHLESSDNYYLED